MKVALITGSNRGLGFETSRQLAKKGFKVYMGCRDVRKGTMAADILKSEGLNVEFIEIDVTKTKGIRKIHDMLRENHENIDVLINNAGVFLESEGPTDQSSSSIFKVDPVIILKTIETNTMGPLKLIQSLVPLMLKSKKGRIINVSSGMGQLSFMGGHWPGYRISKTALNAITCILDAELKDTELYVNSVCPGWVKTDMGGENASLSIEEGVESIVWLATEENIPRGKFIQNKKVIEW